jgi:TPR repeat protein
MYRRGLGVDKDLAEAVRWYRMSAKQGHAHAQFNLAAAYFNGDGVQVSDELALAWFLVASESGSEEAKDGVQRLTAQLSPERIARAKLTVAKMYDDGAELRQDYSKAVKWYTDAADSGYLPAKYILATVYAQGRIIARDEKKVVKLCDEAAKQRYIPALFCMGQAHEKGLGIERDLKKSSEYYKMAAQGGLPQAMVKLAIFLRDGSGIKPNDKEAYMWLLLAKRNGQPVDQDLAQIEARLSAKDRRKVQEKANQWRPARTPFLISRDLR